MSYLTFLAESEKWRLFEGPGSGGAAVSEIASPIRLLDFSVSQTAELWLCGETESGAATILRTALPALRPQPVAWSAGRIGAVAISPDGARCAALNLPTEAHGV